MKKVFISLLLAILVCSPVFAGDLQKQFEAKNNYNNTDFCKKYVQMLIKEDYETFLADGDSMLGRATDLKEKYKKHGLSEDLKYVEKIINLYGNTPEIINIDDKTYNLLQFDTKDLIAFYNSLARLYYARIEF